MQGKAYGEQSNTSRYVTRTKSIAQCHKQINPRLSHEHIGRHVDSASTCAHPVRVLLPDLRHSTWRPLHRRSRVCLPLHYHTTDLACQKARVYRTQCREAGCGRVPWNSRTKTSGLGRGRTGRHLLVWGGPTPSPHHAGAIPLQPAGGGRGL